MTKTKSSIVLKFYHYLKYAYCDYDICRNTKIEGYNTDLYIPKLKLIIFFIEEKNENDIKQQADIPGFFEQNGYRVKKISYEIFNWTDGVEGELDVAVYDAEMEIMREKNNTSMVNR